MLLKGYSLEAISSLRKLTDAVVSMQIETILEYRPETEVRTLFSNGMYELVMDEIKNSGFNDLKELKARIPGNISYALLRVAVAKYRYTSNIFSFDFQDKQ